MSVLELTLLILATWRVAHMLGAEDGPGGVFSRLKSLAGARYVAGVGWTGTGLWARLLCCPLCLSVWVAGVVLVLVSLPDGRGPLAPAWMLIAWLAISGGASMLELLVAGSGRRG